MGQVDRNGQLQLGGTNLDHRFQTTDILHQLQIEEPLGTDLANGPRLKLLVLDLDHLALSIQAEAQRFGFTLDDFNR